MGKEVSKFKLEGEHYIELCDLLKTTGMCETGGMAKYEIADGQVMVDGIIEQRKRYKVRPDQIIEYNGEQVKVIA
jgi:ribosome-associated protein